MTLPQSQKPVRMTIAIIEDDDDQRVLIRHALELRGYQVREFMSAEEAFGWNSSRQQGAAPPIGTADLILLDIKLPGLSGIETLQLIKETPRLRSIPVAMLTAERTSETVLHCIRSGASDYFVKPLDLAEVMRRIDRLLSDPGGLLNRTAAIDLKWGFQDFLIRELRRSERCDDPLCIILGGIRRGPQAEDSFSADQIDDLWAQLPHEKGSERQAVEIFTQACQRVLREYDVLVPFGTGEFAGIFPGTDRSALQAILRKLFGIFQQRHDLPPLQRTERWVLLVGGANFPVDGRDRLTLFTAAEGQLADTPPPRETFVVDPDDPVHLKTVQCPGCGHHYTYPKMASRKIKAISRESDLRIVYEDLDPLFYGIAACPDCGLAVLENELAQIKTLDPPAFGWQYQAHESGKPFTRPSQTVVPEELAKRFAPPYETWLSKEASSASALRFPKDDPAINRLIQQARPSDSLWITREMALARHLLARETYHAAGGSPFRRARIAHRIAWLHRIGNEKELEARFLSEALNFYLTAFHFEELREARPTEIEIFYLLGELSFRLGKEEDAVAIFDKLVKDPRLEGNEAFRRMVRRRWYEARHEDPAQA
ncbi:MAG: DUF2225 domain-containing protein [Candidatus Omnitrophica bacterium]|nr:DUF2225 domain-containing protein [bacterium]MCE7908192.1 DUF2225 domain-containing protein [Candidatus Omnitrophica bacterium COP1]MCL4734945.1 DUF2225 domain-containing protein [Candidatus Omnitrophota bacterium]MCL4736533.1 DUF2225 domain-containing protein [Candidatus Omnitrophota bacterium]